jgi:pyridoxal phosphate enzyme (YggS family)
VDNVNMERFRELEESLASARERLAKACDQYGRKNVELMVVTKTHPVSDIEILYQLGVRSVGENRDQEGRVKAEQLPSDLTWNMIGQIQSKKINSIARWAQVIQTCDRLSLVEKFSQAAHIAEKNIGLMIQVSLDPNSPVGRGGVQPDQVMGLAAAIDQAPSLDLLGLMAVAPHPTTGIAPTDAFSVLARISGDLTTRYPEATQISAGMSEDLEAAIAHGATQVRLGSAILGARDVVQ